MTQTNIEIAIAVLGSKSSNWSLCNYTNGIWGRQQ